MKKHCYYSLIVLIMLSISCKKKSETTTEPESSITSSIVGMYDAKQYNWYIYDVGGTYGPQIHDKVLEIQQVGQDYNFFVDGEWQAKLKVDKIYDNIIYMTIGFNSGMFSDGTFFDCEGWYSPLANISSYHASFQLNKNKKLEVCMKFYNLKSNQQLLDYWILVYWEGNKRLN